MKRRPRLLDTFCRAGGASMGYYMAGFEVVGVDQAFQPDYPFKFYQADAFEFIAKYGRDFDVVHASPHCQNYSRSSAPARASGVVYPDQVGEVRDLLCRTGVPYVIENVPLAPLVNWVMLCGTMFGLGVQRHRLFECSPMILMSPFTCNHDQAFITVTGHGFLVDQARDVMGISWMKQGDLSQAIPPVYTHWVGRQMLRLIGRGGAL